MDDKTKRAILEHVFDRLNGDQREAAGVTRGELMISAGAGTGKTYTLTAHYIASVLALEEPRADRVLAITYTKAAAGELAERIRATLENAGAPELARQMSGAWVSTFHSFCGRVLRAEAAALTGEDALDPYFREIDDLEASSILAQAIEITLEQWALAHGEDLAVLYRLKGEGAVSKALIDIVQACQTFSVPIDTVVIDPSLVELSIPWVERSRRGLEALVQLAVDVERTYTELKRRRSVLDFGDLITRVDRLFTSNPEVVRRYREKFVRILVDEFQDTNHIQYRIVRALSANNITRVGDRSQSIYGFQGAQADVFDRAIRDVEEAAVRGEGYPPLSLSVNYRSHPHVLELVNNVFSAASMFGEGRIVALKAGRDEDDPKFNRPFPEGEADHTLPRAEIVMVQTTGQPALTADNYDRESAAIAERVAAILATPGTRLSLGDVAVVVRARTHAERLVKALNEREIPAYTLGGRGLLNDPAVAAVLALLGVVDSTSNEPALVRLLVSSLGRVSDQALANVALSRRVADTPLTLWDALSDPNVEVSASDRLLIDGLVATVEQARAAVGILPIGSIIRAAIAQRGLDLALIAPLADGSHNYAGRQSYANVMHLADIAGEWEGAGGSLRGFLDDVAQKESDHKSLDLAGWEGGADDAGAVRIMTIHATKGLEYPVVVAAFGTIATTPRYRSMLRLRWSGAGDGTGVMVASMPLELSASEKAELRRMANEQFPGTKQNARTKERYGVGLSKNEGVFKSPEVEAKEAEARESEISELKRLQYVAMTRARDRLFISYQADPKIEERAQGDDGKSPRAEDAFHAALLDHYLLAGEGGYRLRQVLPSPLSLSVVEIPAPSDDDEIVDAAPPAVAVQVTPASEGSDRSIEYERPRAPKDNLLAQVSASHIKTLRDCPRQFYLKYREGLGTLRYGGATSATNLGNALHALMQQSWGATSLAQDVVDRVAGVHRLSADDTAQVVAATAALLGTDVLAQVRAVGGARAEHQFYELIEGDIDGAPRQVYLQGFIDLIAVDGAGVATIVDYKTGKGSQDKSRYQTQAECYALVALRGGATRVRVAFVMPEATGLKGVATDGGIPVHWFEFADADRETLERSVLEAHRDMERAGEMDDDEIEAWLTTGGGSADAKRAGEVCTNCGYGGPLCAVGKRHRRAKR